MRSIFAYIFVIFYALTWSLWQPQSCLALVLSLSQSSGVSLQIPSRRMLPLQQKVGSRKDSINYKKAIISNVVD